jgi:excisionase family DNA binding protein
LSKKFFSPINDFRKDKMKEFPIYVSAKTLSEILDAKVSTIYHWKDNGVIPYTMIGGCVRFNLEKVKKRLEELDKECIGEIRDAK